MTKKQFVNIYKTLSDYTRFEVFAAIVANPNVSGKALLTMFSISQPTLSFHISKLEAAKLIVSTKQGQSHHYSVNKTTQAELIKFTNEMYK